MSSEGSLSEFSVAQESLGVICSRLSASRVTVSGYSEAIRSDLKPVDSVDVYILVDNVDNLYSVGLHTPALRKLDR